MFGVSFVIWRLHRGQETIPEFARTHPGVTCDFISIDGNHATPAVLNDIKSMRHLAAEHTILVMDDVQSWSVRRDIYKAIDSGLIGVAQVYSAERYSIDKTFSSTFGWNFWHGDFNRGKLYLEGYFKGVGDNGGAGNIIYESRMGELPSYWYSSVTGWLADTFRWKK